MTFPITIRQGALSYLLCYVGIQLSRTEPRATYIHTQQCAPVPSPRTYVELAYDLLPTRPTSSGVQEEACGEHGGCIGKLARSCGCIQAYFHALWLCLSLASAGASIGIKMPTHCFSFGAQDPHPIMSGERMQNCSVSQHFRD